jgi:hypothetical protein
MWWFLVYILMHSSAKVQLHNLCELRRWKTNELLCSVLEAQMMNVQVAKGIPPTNWVVQGIVCDARTGRAGIGIVTRTDISVLYFAWNITDDCRLGRIMSCFSKTAYVQRALSQWDSGKLKSDCAAVFGEIKFLCDDRSDLYFIIQEARELLQNLSMPRVSKIIVKPKKLLCQYARRGLS